MKIDQIITGIKIAVLVGKAIITGKHSETLDKIDQAADIAKAVKKTIKGNKK